MLYGPASVGKSCLLSKSPLACIIDCTEMVNLIGALEDVDTAIEYLERRFVQFAKDQIPGESTLIFDNINGLCAQISSD